ncbi:hypothetical protein L596_001704 [Steinernema carpocapsae]|uniref:Uncharacterized protein n=1 Tax=Steinernema carpocapsae TaxID=34508 RepID=A0A4V6I777_STECR|nr:hypothetical protein L596_001704 [Steinernema carpocapsae]
MTSRLLIVASLVTVVVLLSSWPSISSRKLVTCDAVTCDTQSCPLGKGCFYGGPSIYCARESCPRKELHKHPCSTDSDCGGGIGDCRYDSELGFKACDCYNTAWNRNLRSEHQQKASTRAIGKGYDACRNGYDCLGVRCGSVA